VAVDWNVIAALQAKLTNILATSKATAEKMQKECAQLHDRVAKLQADLEEHIHQNTELLADNGQKQLLLKTKEEEISSVKAETTRVAKLRDQTVKKLKALEEGRAEAEAQRDTLKTGAPQPCCQLVR
jgi:predicted nuclease with TOPRIM domain